MTETPWGPIGYISYKRTYSRKLNDNPNARTEEFPETIARVIDASENQLKIKWEEGEKEFARKSFLGLKCSVAGRFLWQLGTKTVSKLGLLSLQNCAFRTIDSPIEPFCWAFDALMLGAGVGFNIQRENVYKIPKVCNKKLKIVRKDTNDADFIVPDSREGWIELLRRTLEAFFVTGKSFSYSTVCVRSKGAPIKGFGGVASGPEELCWGIDQIAKVLNDRSGKNLRSIDCLDILCIIGYVVVSGNVRRSAIIFLGDMDDFQYLSAKRWDLGNIPNWRAMANCSVVCNEIARLPQQVWDGYQGNGECYGLINLGLSKSCGRLGETQYPDEDVQGYNPCVSGDTEVLTEHGYRRIQTLCGKETKIWNGEQWSSVVPDVTGHNKRMIKVCLSDGRSLVCTENHNWLISKDYQGNFTKTKTLDLKIGDKICKYSFPVLHGTSTLQHPYTQGFISGDGQDNENHFFLYQPKFMCENRFTGISHVSKEYDIAFSDCKRKIVSINFAPLPKDFVPIEYDLRDKLDWLSGLFDADGTELVEGGLQLVSVNKEFLLSVQKLLSTCGANSKVISASDSGWRELPDGRGGKKEFFCQETNRICISAAEVQALIKWGLKCERLSFDKTPNRDASRFVTIKSLEDAGVADTVYCFTDPINGTGVFNGIMTGQCAEMSQEDGETCCLGELFLPLISSYEELLGCIKILYKYCKHSLALPCHLSVTEKIVHKNMRMGIGVTGYLQASEEQRSWLDKAYVFLRQYDVEYSKANGFPVSKKLTTTKPSGTLSLLPGVTPGVHPGYSRYFIRRVRLSANSKLVDVCKAAGYHTEYQVGFDGVADKNTVVVSFPCSYPEGTVLAKELSAVEQMKFVRRLQSEWSDNAVSCTVYYRKEELPEIKAYLLENYDESIKTVSFLLHSDHGFQQAPYEEISEEKFLEMSASCKQIQTIVEIDDGPDSSECATGACPIR